MKRPMLLIMGTLLLAAAGLVAVACSPAPQTPPPLAPAPTIALAAATTAAAAPNTSSASGQTFTVLVGAEDTSIGAEMYGFFPATVHVHPGDTVVWKENTHEIHTVTFLGNQTTVPDLLVPVPNGPQGAMMINPMAGFPAGAKEGNYDGSTFTSSGIMGMDQGQVQQFQLTFTKPGTYQYVCIVHSMMKMVGTVVVDAESAAIPTQADDDAQAKKEIDALRAQVPDAQKAANAEAKPDQKNADGTTTHNVIVGWESGQIGLTAFFPKNVNVAPGDTVVWTFGSMNMAAPHTITFLNGAPEPALLAPQPQPNGPPLLLFNPALALPQNADRPLTNKGVYNSGIIDPMAPGPHTFSLKIASDATGTLDYSCLLHDGNGMDGTLTVTR